MEQASSTNKRKRRRKILNSLNAFSLFCWNVGNPSFERASEQALWLHKQGFDVLVLTECKRSRGCFFLERYFQAYGYHVVFPKPEGNEFGVFLASRYPLMPSVFSDRVDYLSSRVASAIVSYPTTKLEIIGIYVPSRNSSYEKKKKKRHFLNKLLDALEAVPIYLPRIFCGDLNIIEPNHTPRYPVFENWEYEFYEALSSFKLKDAFRHLNPSLQEYSWIGRTGDGYRYDHCFVSIDLLQAVHKCYYLHKPRNLKLSDHSALVIEIDLRGRTNV